MLRLLMKSKERGWTLRKEYFLRLEIHELPKMTNVFAGKAHWITAKERTRWKKLVMSSILPTDIPKKPIERARLTCIRHSSMEPDYDGLVSGFKWPIDALVFHGILANDKMSNVGKPDCSWQKAKKGEGKIIIVVEELKEGETWQE